MPMNDKNRVFQLICNHYCSIMDGWVPYPSTIIASITGWRLYYVRKLLKQLKQDGLIESALYVETGEDLDRPALIRGYTLTETGKKTINYKIAYERERAICKECFNMDIGTAETCFDDNDFEGYLNDL